MGVLLASAGVEVDNGPCGLGALGTGLPSRASTRPAFSSIGVRAESGPRVRVLTDFFGWREKI